MSAGKFTFQEGQRISVRGHKLYAVEYHPAERPKAVLCFHHGLVRCLRAWPVQSCKPSTMQPQAPPSVVQAEHIGRYRPVSGANGQILPACRHPRCLPPPPGCLPPPPGAPRCRRPWTGKALEIAHLF